MDNCVLKTTWHILKVVFLDRNAGHKRTVRRPVAEGRDARCDHSSKGRLRPRPSKRDRQDDPELLDDFDGAI